MSQVRIFVTGGTFDKEYDEITGALYFQKTHLQEMFKLARCHRDLYIETLMMIDSSDMTEEQRDYICERAQACPEKRLIITHGTDTMVETASLLAQHITDKTIVLTGAMIPYKFGSSDGLFNLGSALAYVDALPKGVYIAMNGQYFHWNNVKKDKHIGRFVTLNTQ